MGWLNLRAFPDDLHDTLRITAAKRKISIKECVAVAVREWLEREGELPEHGKKKAKGRPGQTGRPL